MNFSIFLKKHKISIILILIFISLISFYVTIKKGLLNGCDFQWHPSKLFWDGVNHYQLFLKNGKWDFLCQGGQYGHLLQVILYPYAIFKWEIARTMWVLTNVILTFAIPYILIKKLKISNFKSLFLIMIFMTCYPTRMTINYGQHSLLVLFLLILPYLYKSNIAYFFSGFASIKYSTGYIIFLDFLVQKKWKNFILASLPYLAGWFFYFLYTSSDPINNFFEPLIWSIKMNYARDNDIYSLLNIYIFSHFGSFAKYLGIIIIFLLNFFLLKKINTIQDNILKFSLILICPLIFFPHSNYDYVLFFPLLCFSLMKYNFLINKINFYFIIYYFYFNRIIKHLLDMDVFYQPLILLFMITIVFLNIHSYNHEKKLIIFSKRLI